MPGIFCESPEPGRSCRPWWWRFPLQNVFSLGPKLGVLNILRDGFMGLSRSSTPVFFWVWNWQRIRCEMLWIAIPRHHFPRFSLQKSLIFSRFIVIQPNHSFKTDVPLQIIHFGDSPFMETGRNHHVFRCSTDVSRPCCWVWPAVMRAWWSPAPAAASGGSWRSNCCVARCESGGFQREMGRRWDVNKRSMGF